MENEILIKNVKTLINAYNLGLLRETVMPEDTHPDFKDIKEAQISFFTLPMALNYQRNSYKLWKSATETFNDKECCDVFDIRKVVNMEDDVLRNKLLKYKLALQPNNHIKIWKTISETVHNNFVSFVNMIKQIDNDFLKLREVVQKEYKKGFPYLSGPKIFNYWSYILTQYGGIVLKNSEYIEIAPDTHVIQASIRLGVISKEESGKISREEISRRWREKLKDSKINPIDVHSPLWFWSRSGFKFVIKNDGK
jgi:hypothetical protein